MTKFSYKTPPPPTLMLVFETVLIRDRHTVRNKYKCTYRHSWAK